MSEPAPKLHDPNAQSVTPATLRETAIERVGDEVEPVTKEEWRAFKAKLDKRFDAQAERLRKLENKMLYLTGGLGVAGAIGWAVFNKVFFGGH